MKRAVLNNAFRLNASRAFSGSASNPPAKPAAAAKAINSNVPGLSANIVKPKSQPLGPGAASDGTYKVPEYYSYDRFSYHEAEVEMAKYRCPQPTARNWNATPSICLQMNDIAKTLNSWNLFHCGAQKREIKKYYGFPKIQSSNVMVFLNFREMPCFVPLLLPLFFGLPCSAHFHDSSHDSLINWPMDCRPLQRLAAVIDWFGVHARSRCDYMMDKFKRNVTGARVADHQTTSPPQKWKQSLLRIYVQPQSFWIMLPNLNNRRFAIFIESFVDFICIFIYYFFFFL